jgi:hypothetical protein
MIAALSIISSKYINIPRILLITLLLVLISTLTKILINLVFNYTTIGESGEIVTIRTALLASIMTLLTAEILSLVTAGIGKLIFKR